MVRHLVAKSFIKLSFCFYSIGHGDFEMGDLDTETTYPGLKRNHNHRISAISNLSDSSDDSSSGTILNRLKVSDIGKNIFSSKFHH